LRFYFSLPLHLGEGQFRKAEWDEVLKNGFIEPFFDFNKKKMQK
jgi:hypothetical protein